MNYIILLVHHKQRVSIWAIEDTFLVLKRKNVTSRASEDSILGIGQLSRVKSQLDDALALGA